MPTRRFPGAKPVQAWLLAALLLVAQGLGLAHRVAHAPGLGQAGVSASARAHFHGHAQAGAPAAWADGHEADTADCRLIDQLAHADGLSAADGATAPAPQSSVVAAAACAAAPSAGSASAYLARAPPRA